MCGIAACCARPMGTLTGREVFSDTHMSRRKTDCTLFRRCGGETLRGPFYGHLKKGYKFVKMPMGRVTKRKKPFVPMVFPVFIRLDWKSSA